MSTAQTVVTAITDAVPAHIVDNPVSVQTVGWNWTSYGVWALVALLSPILLALMRLWPTLIKLKQERDGSMFVILSDRLVKVENDLLQARDDLSSERDSCDKRLRSMQNKMDAITRQFVQFQLTIARYLPGEYAARGQEAADNLLRVIARDADEFAEHEAHEEPHG